MEYLIKKFQQEPHLGDQVEYLIIEHFKGGYDDMNKLPSLLSLTPNLRYFYHQAWYGSYVKIQSLIQPWCKRIEHLAIHGSRSITINLIFYNKFEQIRSLYIPRKNVFDPACFSKVTNLHTLTELTLDQCGVNLTFFHLEYLFEKLPSLESLTIIQLGIMYDALPLDIVPVTSLKKLHLASIQSTDVKTRVRWLQYIGKKFPNVSDLQNKYINDELSEEVDELGNTTDILEGYTSLFHGLASKLTTLDIQSESLPHTFFELLDNAGCLLHYLKLSTRTDSPLFQNIGNSKQAESIQTLEISFNSLSDLKWLITMTRLRTLVVNMLKRTRPIQLNAFLNLCPPTLVALEMFQMNLSVGMRGYPHPLQSLTLTKCRFYNPIDVFISTYLQQLHTIKIYYCLYTFDDASKLNIPNHALTCFEMVDSENRPHFSVLVVTSKEKRLYKSGYKSRKIPLKVQNNELTSLCPPTRCSVPGPRVHHDFMLRCASVGKVIL
ncbi:hypothetical protein K501DRAFT_283694 [Backusella circina FSU 941]|nr:hypothetical protein K501DRAFT_283694 [Backusella circina FSU 941]